MNVLVTSTESWEIQPRKLLDVNRFGQKLVLWRDLQDKLIVSVTNASTVRQP